MSLICGVISASDPSLATPAILNAMLAASQHRARDGSAKSLAPEAGVALAYGHTATFAQRREVLSWHRDEDFVSAVDGDVNEPQDLLRQPNRFESEHAGAVVSNYEADPDHFPAFDGFFSFFLWDRRRNILHLATDALSRKIVHYYHDSENRLFAFSSELRGLL